jgi:hypothetical protein
LAYLGAPGAVIADVLRFMHVYEPMFGLWSPDESRVLMAAGAAAGTPAALWHRGVLTQHTLAWLGRN